MADPSSTPLAIIGIGCRLPGGAYDTESLWNVLAKGENTWSPVPPERFNETAFYHPSPGHDGTTNHHGGHFLKQTNGIAAFDAGFFGMSTAEAQATDPQQRLLLEVSYEAFENAGIPMDQVRGSDTAVYAAMFTRDYDRHIYKDPSQIPRYQTTGCGEAILSNRISYCFDLTGPSITLDTGCSGSLVALHQACQSLRARECRAALACGVNLILSPDQMIGMSNMHMLNDDGRSYPFDARGKGYGRGEGVTAVILKRLDDALDAGDNVRAIVRNTAINQDGKTNGITHPNYKAQEALHRRVYRSAGLDPSTVQYVECHGTGTVAGDMAELRGIFQAFGEKRSSQSPICVGSIKSNIGHLESSSGLAGLIKTVVMLEKGCILPNADFRDPKADIQLEEWKIRIPRKLEYCLDLRTASVNSFGYGGVNAHVVLERAPARQPNPSPDQHCDRGKESMDGEKHSSHKSCLPQVADAAPLPEISKSAMRRWPSPNLYGQSCGDRTLLSNGDGTLRCTPSPESTVKGGNSWLFTTTAVSQAQLLESIERLHLWISTRPEATLDFESLAYTLFARRSIYTWRHTFQASSREEILSTLNRKIIPIRCSKMIKLIFIFTGQGAQWHAMGRGLANRFSVFRDSLLRSDKTLRQLGASWALIDELARDEQDSRIHSGDIAQPATTALQIAMVDMLASFAVRPTTVIGHSSGEIAAAYAAGAISHTTALKISFQRSLLVHLCKQKLSAKGAMLSVGLGENEVSPFLEDNEKGSVSLACVNSPSSTTLSGDELAINELQKGFNALGIFNRRLKVDTAYHSHHMCKVAPDYLLSLATVKSGTANNAVQFISSVTGLRKSKGFGAEYWVENLVSTVRFSEALQEYCRLELNSSHTGAKHVYIELGPHGALSGPIGQTLDKAPRFSDYVYIPTLTRGKDAVQSILSLSGKLFEHGHQIDVTKINSTASRLSVLPNLPTFPWDHSRTYWHDSRLSKDYHFRLHPCHDLLGLRLPSSPDLEPVWRYILSLDTLPWLADHVIDGLVTFPGAGYICMVIEASRQIAEQKASNSHSFILQDIKFLKALTIPEAPEKVEMQLCLHSQQLYGSSWYEFRIYAISQTNIWHEYCRGRVSVPVAGVETPQIGETQLPETRLFDPHLLSAREVYSNLQSNGNTYGPCFACVRDLQMTDSQAISHVTIPDTRSTMPAEFQQSHVIHPATLDALLHTALPLYGHQCGSGSVMPVTIEELIVSLQISSTPGDILRVTLDLLPDASRSAFVNIAVSAADSTAGGQPMLIASNMHLVGVGDLGRDPLPLLEKRAMAHHFHWIPQIISNVKEGSDNDDPCGPQEVWKSSERLLECSGDTLSPVERRAKALNKGENLRGHQIRLITAPGGRALASVLASSLKEGHCDVKVTTWDTQDTDPQALYLILDDSQHPFLETTDSELFQHIVRIVHSVFHILWVSVQVGMVDTAIRMNPKSALISGFARSARAEREQPGFHILDIQDDTSRDLQASTRAVIAVTRGLLSCGDEMEFIYRDGQMLVPRLVPERELEDQLAEVKMPRWDETLYLQSSRPLKMDVDSVQNPRSLNYIDDLTALHAPDAKQVIIEVSAQPFTSSHITKLAERTADSSALIREFSGTITAVGSEAKNTLAIGDTVVGWNLNGPAYASHARAEVCNIARIPGQWSSSIATISAMIVPLMAAYYFLADVAKLRQGQSVLIHGATGAYGHCAIGIAKNIGAVVFATISTEAERDDFATKYQIPLSHIFSVEDSRSINLKTKILKLTAERGVDALATMPHEVFSPGLRGCIAALGVYVHILQGGEAVDIPPPDFRGRAISCVSFSLETIALHRPDILANTLDKAVSMVITGTAPSLDVRQMPLSEMNKTLANSRAGENIVLTSDAETMVRVPRVARTASEDLPAFSSNGTYIIAGGLGDLGRKISTLMAKRRVRYLVLLSRRSLSQVAFEDFQEILRQDSPELMLYCFVCDISDRMATSSVAQSLAKLKLPPVRGVIQAATVLHDRVLERMNIEDWRIPLQTKVYGTSNLNDVFGSASLDFFIMLSSLSGVVGTRGQANYAAGNTYLDALAQRNMNHRTAYIALDLGMIVDTSTYDDLAGQKKSQSLLRQGFIPIEGDQFVAVLEWALLPKTWRRGSGQFCIGIDDVSIVEAESPTPTIRSAMFSLLRDPHEIKAAGTVASSSYRKPHITSADSPADVLQILLEATSQKISSLISVGEEYVILDKPLQDLGLDSLTAIELKNFIRKEFSANVHASEILDEPSLTALCGKIASRSEILRDEYRNNLEAKPLEESDIQQSPQAKLTNEHPLPVEPKLPTLPLPTINDSIDLYLTSARPFLDATAFKKTSKAAQTFREGSGRLLQDKLESRLRTQGIDGWHYDLQVPGVYLRRRLPIHPYGTFYGVHVLTKQAHSQAERAAIITESAYAFMQNLEAKNLEQDCLNEEPLCSESLRWFFNACREPFRDVDRMKKYGRENYAVVLRRGHIFRVTLEKELVPIPRTDLINTFENILQVSTEELASIATLTADERNSWTALREKLKNASILNIGVLEAMEAASFVICLDDVSPTTATERCNQLLLGDPGNRWSDKTLQFVVCANGISGFICEHSMLDAASVRQVNEYITTAIVDFSPGGENRGAGYRQGTDLKELKFDLDDLVAQNIDRVRKNVGLAYSSIEFAHLKLPLLGKDLFRQYKLPSKTGIQITIQLASLLYYGVQHPSWETLTMMLFHHGRLDWMQTVSPAMFKFCQTAFDESIDIAQRSKLLREAATTHAKTMTRISRGRGFAAHLEALRELAQQEGERVEFFEDPSWEMMHVTSTRKLKTDASEGLNVQEAGFYMPDPESVLVHYEIEEMECRFSVQCTEGKTDKLCSALEKAAQQVRKLLEVP